MFGSPCYAAVTTPHKDKFAPCSLKCIFLGYPFATKGYKVLDLDTRKVFISRDVVFVESCFPFQNTSLISQNSVLFTPTKTSSADEPLFFDDDSSSQDTIHHNVEQHSSNSLDNTHSGPSCRPVRIKTVPNKFKDFTGLPTHLATSVSYLISLN